MPEASIFSTGPIACNSKVDTFFSSCKENFPHYTQQVLPQLFAGEPLNAGPDEEQKSCASNERETRHPYTAPLMF